MVFKVDSVEARQILVTVTFIVKEMVILG